MADAAAGATGAAAAAASLPTVPDSKVGGDGDADKRVPVYILTGFLGSGKTTLLNHILERNHGRKLAVIENEFGEEGIDDELVKQKFDTDEELFEMNNGCICCSVRGDLVRILKKLMKRAKKLDGIVIETTGLADPAPVAQTFFMDEKIGKFARLDAIITVVDAKHVTQHLDEKKPEGIVNEAQQQVAFADRLLLNKLDLVTPEEADAVESRLRGINAFAEVIRCTRSDVPMDRILNAHAFDLSRILKNDPDFLKDEDAHDHDHDHDHDHEHGHCGECGKEGGEHAAECGHKHDDDKCGECGKEGGCEHKGHHHHHHHGHKHDDEVGSLSIRAAGDVDPQKLNAWMSELLQTKGPDIFRMKGVLAMAGMPDKFVFQGVHMVFTGEPVEPWKEGEARRCRLVFIGRDLNEKELRDGFTACLAEQPADGAAAAAAGGAAE